MHYSKHKTLQSRHPKADLYGPTNMAAPSNRASWLMAKQEAVSSVSDAPYTPPSTNELVVKNRAVAMNPADVVIQKAGVLLTQYPAILGCDVAGDVVDVHPSLAQSYRVGDRVIGASNPLRQKDGVYCYSGFQEFVVLEAPGVAKIPEGVAYEDAVVLPLGINTAASCLFAPETLGLKMPLTPRSSTSRNETLLVWGASSSVGACAVQLASRAGYDVVGIASGKNHAMAKELGVSICFDHSDPDVVEKAVAYLTSKQLAGAFISVNSDSGLAALCRILERTNGKKLIVSVTPGAEAKAKEASQVKIRTNFAISPMNADNLQAATWTWLNQALEASEVKYLPKSDVVGNGLRSVQGALDQLAAGVSAKKLVVLI